MIRTSPPLFSFPSPRHRRAPVGLPGGGVRPAGEHREVQQPPLRQEQERRLCARGQLPAERAGPARGAARGLPLQLRDVAGEGGLLSAHPVGGAAAESVTEEGWGGEVTHEPVGAGGTAYQGWRMGGGEGGGRARGRATEERAHPVTGGNG